MDAKMLALVLLLVIIPSVLAETPSQGSDILSLFSRFLGIPKELMTIDKMFIYLIIPFAIIVIILNGLLDELGIFSERPDLHMVLAILIAFLLMPAGVFSKLVLAIFGGGGMAIIVLFGFGVMIGFLDKIAPRFGIPLVATTIVSNIVLFGAILYIGGLVMGFNPWAMTPFALLFGGLLGVVQYFRVRGTRRYIDTQLKRIEMEEKRIIRERESLVRKIQSTPATRGSGAAILGLEKRLEALEGQLALLKAEEDMLVQKRDMSFEQAMKSVKT